PCSPGARSAHLLARSVCLLSRTLPCCPVPRLLRSFPTRRSSDLEWGRCILTFHVSVGLLALHGPTNNVAAAMRTASGSMPAPKKDRKSTRLNSSHVKISYAVFCLKKRINVNTQPSAQSTTLHHPR